MKTPTITSTHDWMRVNFGNNRGLSCSYSSIKASGSVPAPVFQLWADAHDFKAPALAKLGIVGDTTHGAIINAFVAQIDTIWPEWCVAPKIPKVGETVTVNFGKRKGLDSGVVEKVRGTMLTVRFKREGLVGVPADMVE